MILTPYKIPSRFEFWGKENLKKWTSVQMDALTLCLEKRIIVTKMLITMQVYKLFELLRFKIKYCYKNNQKNLRKQQC
jgi:hypothetical protein